MWRTWRTPYRSSRWRMNVKTVQAVPELEIELRILAVDRYKYNFSFAVFAKVVIILSNN